VQTLKKKIQQQVRAKTDSLDAAGNTTAAIGKGFAIGSAALVSLALFGAFSTRTAWLETLGVNILRPVTFSFLIIGAMLPYVLIVSLKYNEYH
jgi:inorganic pyrophosphatase